MPDRASVAATAFFLVFWVVVYGGASALSGLVPWRIDLALPYEQHIPLVPLAAIPYVSMGGLLILAPVTLQRWERVRPLFYALILETIAAAIVFVLLPVRAHPWIEPEPQGFSMALADAMNLERNFFPSLHVTYAWTAASAIARHTSARISAACWLWAIAITVSTVLLRQHYLLDAAGGALLAIAVDRITQRTVPASPRPL